jgi:hypothetical protein
MGLRLFRKELAGATGLKTIHLLWLHSKGNRIDLKAICIYRSTDAAGMTTLENKHLLPPK